jgi:hypothetical protein
LAFHKKTSFAEAFLRFASFASFSVFFVFSGFFRVFFRLHYNFGSVSVKGTKVLVRSIGQKEKKDGQRDEGKPNFKREETGSDV